MYPLNWTSKCQNLTIEEQYSKGVKLFDIRIKIVKNKIYSGHGLATYKADFGKIFSYLNLQRNCTVRLLLEGGSTSIFVDFVNMLIAKYSQIHFVGGQRKKDWEQVVDLPGFDCADYHWKHLKWWMIPNPLKYAKKYNQKNKENINEYAWSLFDFVEL